MAQKVCKGQLDSSAETGKPDENHTRRAAVPYQLLGWLNGCEVDFPCSVPTFVFNLEVTFYSMNHEPVALKSYTNSKNSCARSIFNIPPSLHIPRSFSHLLQTLLTFVLQAQHPFNQGVAVSRELMCLLFYCVFSSVKPDRKLSTSGNGHKLHCLCPSHGASSPFHIETVVPMWEYWITIARFCIENSSVHVFMIFTCWELILVFENIF